MTPPVLDSRPPVAAPQPEPSSIQNPNPNSQTPFDFGAFSLKNNFSGIMDSSSVDNASEGSFGAAFSSPGMWRTAPVNPPVSAGTGTGTGRSRPRLVKCKKRFVSQIGKSSTVSSEFDSGFNPFRSKSVSSDRINDVSSGTSSSAANGFNAFVSDSKFGNVGFVFSANRSDADANLESIKSKTSGSVDKSGFGDNGKMEKKNESEYGKFDNVGFVFGANQSDLELNLDLGKRETCKIENNVGYFDNGKVENKNELDCGKFDNVNFVLGTNDTDSELNLDLGKREFRNSVDNLGSFDNGDVKIQCESEYLRFDRVGFVVGTNQSDSELKLDSGKRGLSKSVDKSGSYDSDSGLNLNSEKRESSDSVGKLETNYKAKTKTVSEVECGKHKNVGLVFGAGQSDLASTSNLEKRESIESAGKSCSADSDKMETGIGAEFGNYNDEGFLFGASVINLVLNPNSEKRECVDNVGILVSDDRGKIKVETETEFQNERAAGVNFTISGMSSSSDGVYEKGVFAFGSSSSQSSSFNNSRVTKLPYEMNKLDIASSGNCDEIAEAQNTNSGSDAGIAKTENGNLGFDGNNCSFAFRSSGNIASASGTSAYKLPDEMKKLNINDFGKVNCAGNSKDSDIKLCTNAEKIFVFRSGTKTSCSSAGSLAIACDQIKNSNSGGSMSGDAVEKTNGVNLKTSDETDLIFGSSIDIASATNGIFGLKPFTSQAGLGGSSDACQFSQGQVNDNTKLNEAGTPSSFSSSGLGFQPNGGVFEVSSLGGIERKDGFSFTSTPDKLGASFTDLGTPKWDPSCFKANLFPGLSKNIEISAKSRPVDKRSKKMRGKLRQPTLARQCPVQDFSPRESSSQGNSDSPGSPMDFSPYQEPVAADQCPPETSVTSIESSHLDNNFVSSTAHATVPVDEKDEHLAAAREGFDINNGNFPVEEFISKAETARSGLNTEQVCSSSGAGVAADDARAGCSSSTKTRENNSRTQFSFASGLEDMGERNFTFSASPSAQGGLSATKRHHKKKYRMKVGHDSFNITSNSKVEITSSSVQFSPFAGASSHLDMAQVQNGDLCSSQSKGLNKSKADEEQVKQGYISASAEAQEACEKWRFRGNQAHKSRDLSKAENFYTWGINSVPACETPECCLKPLVLCYSNRAATRMSLGRIREALGDCMMAAALDPNFLKVRMRAASCHLMLGEVEAAMQIFSKCLESGSTVCLDRRIIIEASDGLQKAQKVAECTNQGAELLQQRTSDAAISALNLIAEALSISSHSEKLLEMKAEALFMLRNYEEVIQLCEQTLDFAEKNFAMIGAANQVASGNDHEGNKNSFVKLWRVCFISKSYFHLGRLEVALDLLENQEQAGSITDKCKSKCLESLIPLAVTIRELLCRKNAGNEAFQSGRHAEALEHYTAALSSNVESRPFAAICFCNRAAAHQALGQIADAIADCSLSIALDRNYPKAVSRRATLHEMIRDYGQAASDLQRLVSILEKLSDEEAKQSGRSAGSAGSIKELRQALRRLSSMEQQSKKEVPLDLYRILGIKPSDTTSEIKKAYRKAALRHHPDKAGQFLVRSESGDDGRLWKEIAEEVHKDADRLFKMIGEAYAVLSDPTKRSQYDLEEDMRNSPKETNYSSTFRRESDVHGYPFERSANQQYRRETWKTYGNSHSRWYSHSQW